LTVKVPVPAVDVEAVQPKVPNPLALADAGAFVIAVPLSVPEQVPEPVKL
jgi:hypothetical protein